MASGDAFRLSTQGKLSSQTGWQLLNLNLKPHLYGSRNITLGHSNDRRLLLRSMLGKLPTCGPGEGDSSVLGFVSRPEAVIKTKPPGSKSFLSSLTKRSTRS